MNKYLLTAGLGVALALGGLVYFANATPFLHVATPALVENVKVFHRNVATDNGDGCVTPQEIAGFRTGNFEKIAFYTDDEAAKFKVGVSKVYPDVSVQQMSWAAIDAYKLVAADGTVTVVVTVYNRDDAGELCASGGGPVPLEDWNKIVKEAGLAPEATDIHLGYEAPHPKTLKEFKVQ